MRQLTLEKPRHLRFWDVPEPRLSAPGEALVRPFIAARCDGDALFLRHDYEPWLRLGARLAESVRLALPEGGRSAPAGRASAWLSLGVLPLAHGEAVAWVEMARGLLIHHVRLDGHGNAARVHACHVIAPTEWNFHPDGAVARALEALPATHTDDSRRRLEALMAAYDPCVPFKQDQSMPVEVAHA